MNIVTVVKYKIKDGFEDDFVKAINEYDYSNSLSMRLVSIGANEYLSIMEYDEIDKHCKKNNIDWFATSWDLNSRIFLKKYDLKYNKIASAINI